MQTLYYSAQSLARRQSNVVDFAQYRRRVARAAALRGGEPMAEPCLAPSGDPVSPAQAPAQRPSRRSCRAAMALDLWASMGVVVMTAAFTLRVLMF